jgi:ceramide glucosyltransferase
VVTCLYGADASPNLASRLAALHIEERFAPSVLVAQTVEPLRYCFGATIALRRATLERIGGFAALAETVADDHLLGQLVAGTGRDVVLSPYVVHTAVDEPSLATLWARELRWARTIRSVRPAGWAGAIVSHGVPLALLSWLCAPRDRKRQALLAAACLLRVGLHRAGGRAFAGAGRRDAWLLPLRDCLDAAVWVASFLGREVRWGGETLLLEGAGRIAHQPGDASPTGTPK